MIKVKKYQKEAFAQHQKIGIILVGIMCLLFGLYLVKVPINILTTIVSFLIFIVFVTPYILMGNPTLLKILRENHKKNPKYFYYFVVILWMIAQLYALASSQFAIRELIVSFVWIFSILFINKIFEKSGYVIVDFALIILLWIPLEFKILPEVNIPPVQSFINLYLLFALLVLLYLFLVIRQLDVGFTYRLKGDDTRSIIINFMIFFLIALVLGKITGFLEISRRMPSLLNSITFGFRIFFFITLPEELLFRGVLYSKILNLIHGKYSVGKALVLSAIIFGLSHANNPKSPFIDISLGSNSVWHFPWVYVLLATIAGLFYGWVYIRTKKATAAALLHFLVDWIWYLFFS